MTAQRIPRQAMKKKVSEMEMLSMEDLKKNHMFQDLTPGEIESSIRYQARAFTDKWKGMFLFTSYTEHLQDLDTIATIAFPLEYR